MELADIVVVALREAAATMCQESATPEIRGWSRKLQLMVLDALAETGLTRDYAKPLLDNAMKGDAAEFRLALRPVVSSDLEKQSHMLCELVSLDHLRRHGLLGDDISLSLEHSRKPTVLEFPEEAPSDLPAKGMEELAAALFAYDPSPIEGADIDAATDDINYVLDLLGPPPEPTATEPHPETPLPLTPVGA